MKFLKKTMLLALSIATFFLTSCNDDDSSTSQNGNSKISVKLMDAPGDYDHVYIEVVDVMVKVNNSGEDENGWQSLEAINTGIYDLLELTGGVNVLLVDEFEIPSGTLNQIRLVLGDDNTVVIDGETFDLTTPSAQQSGLKINVNTELEPGFVYDFILDFDVDQSIVVAGNSENIILKPVIRAVAELASGTIQGAVNPYDFQVAASVTVGEEVVSTYADESGIFTLVGIPAGTYDVTINPDPQSGFSEVIVEAVEVVNGQITDIGTIEFETITDVGAITGTVTNASVVATATILVNEDTLSAQTDASGVFLLENVPVGTYIVTITPNAESGLQVSDISNVEVSANTTTDIGSITLE